MNKNMTTKIFNSFFPGKNASGPNAASDNVDAAYESDDRHSVRKIRALATTPSQTAVVVSYIVVCTVSRNDYERLIKKIK